MPLPMVIAHHLLSTAYGWWLPNDPRGSCSTCIASDVIAELGELHFGRKKVQPTGQEIRRFYREAEKLLQHPLLTFSQADVQIIAQAFADVIARERYTCYACAIMPDHFHVVNRKHKHSSEEMIRNFQDASRDTLRAAGHRTPDHPVWGQGGWKVFLDCPDDIRRTIRVRPGQSAEAPDARAGVGFRHPLRRLAPAPGARPELSVREAVARV